MTLEERIKQLGERNAELEKRLADKGSRSEKRLPINPDVLQLSLFSTELDVQEQQRLNAAIAKDEERREKLLKVDGYERKVRKPIDTSRLEVREEHIYPDGINTDNFINFARCTLPEAYLESGTPDFNCLIALALKASKSNVLLINKVCLQSYY